MIPGRRYLNLDSIGMVAEDARAWEAGWMGVVGGVEVGTGKWVIRMEVAILDPKMQAVEQAYCC
jgi:hypothetical protein